MVMQVQNQGDPFEENIILRLMRNYYLTDLVSNEGDRQQNLKGKFSYLKLNTSYTFPVLAVVESSGVFLNEREKRKYMEPIIDYLQQNLGNNSIVFLDEESRIGILFSWTSKNFIESIYTELNSRFLHPVNIGVGKPCNRLENVHHSYHQALLALQGKFYKGIGQIVYYTELGDYLEISDYPIDKEKELFEFIKSIEDGAEIDTAVNDFYQCFLENGLIDRRYIYELTIRLLVGMEKRVLTELKKVSATKSFWIMSIVKMETFQEIKEFTVDYLKELHDMMIKNDNHSSIIKKTIQYIEQECQNASLCSVAKKVYVTPTYLSSLFKMNTGKTFIEQLTETRIQKAKDLLKHTHLKNYEVAERVGYKDSRYFSQIFKKKVGVTPSEYRETVGELVG
jgi:two-component system, response regulator YesN